MKFSKAIKAFVLVGLTLVLPMKRGAMAQEAPLPPSTCQKAVGLFVKEARSLNLLVSDQEAGELKDTLGGMCKADENRVKSYIKATMALAALEDEIGNGGETRGYLLGLSGSCNAIAKSFKEEIAAFVPSQNYTQVGKELLGACSMDPRGTKTTLLEMDGLLRTERMSWRMGKKIKTMAGDARRAGKVERAAELESAAQFAFDMVNRAIEEDLSPQAILKNFRSRQSQGIVYQ